MDSSPTTRSTPLHTWAGASLRTANCWKQPSHGYDVLITCDQGISNEQNLSRYDVTLITIMSGDWTVIRENINLIRPALETAVRGEPNRLRMMPGA